MVAQCLVVDWCTNTSQGAQLIVSHQHHHFHHLCPQRRVSSDAVTVCVRRTATFIHVAQALLGQQGLCVSQAPQAPPACRLDQLIVRASSRRSL